MKIVVKILLIILATLFLLVAGSLIFHDPIISYVLRRVIAVESQEKVRLELESFRLDFLTGRITIEKPALHFEDLYLDEARNIKLNSLSHDLIEVDSLDLRELILDRSIHAMRLLMDKPVFDLIEQGKETKSSFHPEKLITLLNTHPDLFGTMVFRVDEIVINYGSILLSEYIDDEEDPGLVDFTIIFEDFDSHPADSSFDDRFLYSSEFMFVLKDLKRKLRSGYLLNIDSAMYASRRSDLLIRGVSLQPEKLVPEENSIAITAGVVDLIGIELEEIRGLEELNLEAVVVSDGSFINYVNKEAETKTDTTSSDKLDQLTQLIGNFRLDTTRITNVDYLQIHNLKDTLIQVDSVNFLLTGITIDSSSFSDLVRNIGYQEISLSTAGLSIHRIIPEFALRYEDLEYSNIDRFLHVSGLRISTADTLAGRPVFDTEIPKLTVGGLAFANFREEKKHYLTVSVQNPRGKIRLPEQSTRDSIPKREERKIFLSKYIDLRKLEVSKGDFNVVKPGDFEVNVSDLDVLLEGFDLQRFEKDSIQYGRLAVGYGNVDGLLIQQQMNVSSGPMRFEDSRFSVRDISVVSRQEAIGGRFYLGALTLTDFNLDRMIHDKELSVGKVFLVSPVLRPVLNIPERDRETEEKKSFREIAFPISLFMDSISVTNGRIDGNLTANEEKVSLSAGYTLQLGGFSASKDELLVDVVNRITWKYSMQDISAHAAGHQVSLDRLVLDKYKSNFLLEGIDIKADQAVTAQKVRIEQLDLPILAVNGLDYNLIIEEDSVNFTSLRIDDPKVKVFLKKNPKDLESVESDKQFDLREIVLFDYDTVTITNLNAGLVLYDDSSHATFRIDSMNLGHHFSGKEKANLVNYLDFSVKSMLYEDTLQGRRIELSNGWLDPEMKTLQIDELKGKGSNGDQKADMEQSPGIQFTARDVLFKNIKVKESLPSGLHIDNLSFDNLSLDITESQRDEGRKTDLKVNLEIMNRFSRIMTRLSLDTTEIGGINVRLHTMDEAQGHTINIDSIGLFIEKILLDTSMINQEDPVLIDNLTVDLKGKSRITKDSLYEMQTGRLHYNFPSRKITLDSFYVVPRFEDEEFFKRAVYQTDRIRLFGRKLEIKNLYIEQVLNDDFLHCGSVDIHDLQADIYRDKRYPLKPGIYKMLPREQLMGLNSRLAIDSLHIINAFLKYAERDEKADEPGNIFIDNIQGTAYNLTNK
ncbi:MAG: hypothetical protein P8100_04995, partial [bacterium]